MKKKNIRRFKKYLNENKNCTTLKRANMIKNYINSHTIYLRILEITDMYSKIFFDKIYYDIERVYFCSKRGYKVYWEYTIYF